MILVIKLERKKIGLELKKGSQAADSLEWPEDHGLSECLLPRIDEFLKRNDLSLRMLSGVKFESDVDENFTSHRVAKAIAESLRFFLKSN